MKQQQANFPTRFPVGAVSGLLVGVLLLGGVFEGWRYSKPPLQRGYIGQYVKCNAWLAWERLPFSHLFAAGNATEPRRDFTLIVGSTRMAEKVQPRKFYAYLWKDIYEEESPFATLPFWLVGWFLLFLTALIIGGVYDARRHRRAREGEALRGPETLTPDQYNRITKGDGFALTIKA